MVAKAVHWAYATRPASVTKHNRSHPRPPLRAESAAPATRSDGLDCRALGRENASIWAVVLAPQDRAGRVDEAAARARAAATARAAERGLEHDGARRRRSGRRRTLMSGWRRITPMALHGASMQDPVERPAVPPVRRAASRRPRRACAVELEPVESSRARARRAAASRSTAQTSPRPPQHSRMCPVLPPGAAHASSTRWPGARIESARRALRRRRPEPRRSPAAKPGSALDAGCGSSSTSTAASTSGAAAAASPAAASLEIRRARRARQVHAQPQRRRGVVGREDRAASRRADRARSASMSQRGCAEAGFRRRPRCAASSCCALALEAAQHGVDEAAGARAAPSSAAASTVADTAACAGIRNSWSCSSPIAQQRAELGLAALRAAA